MDKRNIQNLWIYSNLLFIINYTLTILSIFVAFPVPKLPSFFNNLLLIFSYALTFQSLFTNLKTSNLLTVLSKISTQPNTYCILLFITFVPNLLLLPFYVLSIYHITSAVLSRKKEFENYFFYELCVTLGKSLDSIGRFALLIELLLTPICFVLLILRQITIFNLISYVTMVRRQVQSNKAMKDVFQECLHCLHSVFLKMPDSYKDYYFSIVNYIRSIYRNEDIPKKLD